MLLIIFSGHSDVLQNIIFIQNETVRQYPVEWRGIFLCFEPVEFYYSLRLKPCSEKKTCEKLNKSMHS